MKTEQMGFAGSAAIIGLIYAAALAAAPEAGLTAQTDPTQTTRTLVPESQTALVVTGVASAAWGKTKVTVF